MKLKKGKPRFVVKTFACTCTVRELFFYVTAEARKSTGDESALSPAPETSEHNHNLLSLFSKSANHLRKSAHKHFQRVTHLRGSFGLGGSGSKVKSSALAEVSAQDDKASVSGHLKLWRERHWSKQWFSVHSNVLYAFKGSQARTHNHFTLATCK